MKITIDIPKEFEKDFLPASYLLLADTEFEDSLRRIKTDIENTGSLSGRYELEIIDMLIEVFNVAIENNFNHNYETEQIEAQNRLENMRENFRF